MQEIQVVDPLWVLKQENSDATTSSPEYERPADKMEVAKYHPTRLLIMLGEFTCEPNRNFPAVTPNSQSSLSKSVFGAP